tara:strand:- start:1072 stop:2079 length:1008 start_codon:yes stop_codon:yes gene_type:complete
MKHCFLHVGFHKTATTSFQLTLQHNRKRLKQEGIVLPKFRSKKHGYSSNHSRQIKDLFSTEAQHLWREEGSKENNIRKGNSLSDHFHGLNELLNQDQSILISGEGISTMPEQSLIKLKSEIERHGFLIKPFALVRSPYAYITSALQQTIKNGKYHPLVGLIPGQNDELNKSLKIPSSIKSINTLNRIFGEKMTYIPFQTAVNHSNGPVLFLLQEVLQLKHADQYQLINANESKSNVGTRLKNFLNQQHPHSDQGELRNLFKTISHKTNPSKFLLTQKEFNQIESEFNKVKREMKRKLGKDFIEEKISFASEFTTEESIQLLSQLSQRLYGFAISA